MRETRSASNEHLSRALGALGFARASGDAFRHNGVSFAVEGGWGILWTAAGAGCDPLASQWGRPGLWKIVSEGLPAGAKGGAGFRRAFEIPLSAIQDGEELGEEDAEARGAASPLGAAVAWGMATLDGQRPAGWCPPSRQQVEELVPEGLLTVCCGHHARQGELAVGEGRLALRMPVLTRVPAGLSESRISWLRQVLLDAQDRWRLVRLGLVGDVGDASVEAEVDLTGVPASLLDGLVPVAASALRCAVSWVVEPCVFIAHAAQEPRALAACPARPSPTERR